MSQTSDSSHIPPITSAWKLCKQRTSVVSVGIIESSDLTSLYSVALADHSDVINILLTARISTRRRNTLAAGVKIRLDT